MQKKRRSGGHTNATYDATYDRTTVFVYFYLSLPYNLCDYFNNIPGNATKKWNNVTFELQTSLAVNGYNPYNCDVLYNLDAYTLYGLCVSH